MGRPSGYTEEQAERVCDKLALGWSLRKIEEHVDEDGSTYPCKDTILTWCWKIEGFSDRYARAQEAGCEAVRQEMQEIADDGRNDWMKRLAFNGGNPAWEINGEAINRSKLRWEDRRWYLGKKQPKKWGEAQQIDMTVKGQMDNTLKIEFVEPSGKEQK
jgi:hypothetical protein